MNRVSLIGRTTRDVELRYTQAGTPVTSFTLAVDRRKKEDGTDFISCTAWGKTAEIMQKYVLKGHRVGICGRIQTGSYEKNGEKRYTTDVVVETLDFLEPKKNDQQYEGFHEIPEGEDDNIPF